MLRYYSHLGICPLYTINIEQIVLPIFDLERSVCDAIKYRNKVGIDVMAEVIQTYLKLPERII
ncbi:hypothetical protein DBK98_018995 [Bacteroides sp. PHL 2737]|uniref:Uncharacterized protein n=1 Tax=Bacteroides fragilis TaxID=817 RepID=A0A4P8MUF9_BACFG|nr:hypothetical protein EC80_018535 [Bacteroides fragilis]QCQ50222.1 hypothetical protein EE52_012775 [Bacteroides fragilis]QLK84062.1 hypothetical protein DBK98_018995 [Bacteroides sp. PHL 2737]RGN61199.1 hypothetical protein DXB60_12760 [Bacteroides fragilis]